MKKNLPTQDNVKKAHGTDFEKYLELCRWGIL